MKPLEKCPYSDCGSYDTEPTEDTDARGSNFLVEKWICFNCNREWNEFYQRTDKVEYLDD